MPALPLSPLTLGTAQLGMPYGIANTRGKPDTAEARAILAAAWEAGFTGLDTAAAYGDSEAVIGRALADLNLTERMTVVTKVPSLEAVRDDPATARQSVEASVAESLRRLRLDRLPVCLFHREEDLPYLGVLHDLQAGGHIGEVGCSVMTPQGMAGATARGVAAVQAPVSLLDRRFEAGIREAERQGVAVFARSVYLQGLLVMPEQDIPTHLTEVLPTRRALERLAADAGMTLAEMALRFVLSLPGVVSVVVGAESVEQVRRNGSCAARGPLPPDLCAAIRRTVPDLPESLIVPHGWAERAAHHRGKTARNGGNCQSPMRST